MLIVVKWLNNVVSHTKWVYDSLVCNFTRLIRIITVRDL